jgi:arylsulfatase A-like enzyme
VEEACDWLAKVEPQPFFLWLHFMDPHAPYYPPAKALQAMGTEVTRARGRYLNEAWKRGDIGPARLRKYRDEIVSLYDAGIRSVDMQVARLAEFLRSRSIWDSTVVVATADHGEEFLDHGSVFHRPSRSYQEMLHVPLLIRMPGLHKKLSAAPFSHLHLAPTILDAVGIDSPDEFEGRSYWREMQAGKGWEIAISESVGKCTNPMDVEKRLGSRVLVLQDQRFKLVLDFERNAEELYDLQIDPHERNCLPKDAERKVRAQMLRMAHEHLARTQSDRMMGVSAIVREIGLEWSHSNRSAETLAT